MRALFRGEDTLYVPPFFPFRPCPSKSLCTPLPATPEAQRHWLLQPEAKLSSDFSRWVPTSLKLTCSDCFFDLNIYSHALLFFIWSCDTLAYLDFGNAKRFDLF